MAGEYLTHSGAEADFAYRILTAPVCMQPCLQLSYPVLSVLPVRLFKNMEAVRGGSFNGLTQSMNRYITVMFNITYCPKSSVYARRSGVVIYCRSKVVCCCLPVAFCSCWVTALYCRITDCAVPLLSLKMDGHCLTRSRCKLLQLVFPPYLNCTF